MATVTNINDVLDGHVALEIECVDRMLLNVYVPNLQVGGQLCTYFPYPGRVWVNGHERAKCQADHAGLGHRALANGFESCDDPAALQGICDPGSGR
jgi:hypothetical protein